MKTHGFMILVRLQGTRQFEPINPRHDMDYDAWFYNRDTCMNALYSLQRREDAKPEGNRNEYIFSYVKGASSPNETEEN